MSESLHLTVFDTKVWQKPSSDGGNVRKIEKRWLGSVSFPFTTLYTSSGKGRIDGVFAIDAPPHILGYTMKPPQEKKKKDGKDSSAPGLPKRPSLQVCVSLDPPLKQPGAADDGLDTVRLPGQPALDLLIKRWMEDCSAPMHCRTRQYEALGRSLHRDWVLSTRFVTPQAPPVAAYNPSLPMDKQMLQLARYSFSFSVICTCESWTGDGKRGLERQALPGRLEQMNGWEHDLTCTCVGTGSWV